MFKSGFVSVVGRSNVGKSSILNKIIGEQVSIVSSKAQTTRKNLKLIYNDENSQIIFIDTPGFQKPKNELGKAVSNFSSGFRCERRPLSRAGISRSY